MKVGIIHSPLFCDKSFNAFEISGNSKPLRPSDEIIINRQKVRCKIFNLDISIGNTYL